MSWICLSCARHGGRQQDCVTCECAYIPTIKEKADKAVIKLIAYYQVKRQIAIRDLPAELLTKGDIDAIS